jgi:uncharacterized membrane protein YeiH
LDAGLPYLACILIGVVGPTAGRFLIDITSGVTPQHFVRGEWFVGTAVFTSIVYLIADAGLSLDIWPATLIAVAAGFLLRFTARRLKWEEPMAPDPAGRPILTS